MGRKTNLYCSLRQSIKQLDNGECKSLQQWKSEWAKKDKIAVKMHLGFQDGYQTIPVFFVRRIVEALKKTGGYPFITDVSTSVYNAVNRGYTQETCGCPIIPVAGVKDGYSTPVEINFKGFDTLELGGVLKDADVLVDLSHAKGHGAGRMVQPHFDPGRGGFKGLCGARPDGRHTTGRGRGLGAELDRGGDSARPDRGVGQTSFGFAFGGFFEIGGPVWSAGSWQCGGRL